MDSNLTNSEIEKDLRMRLGIGAPSSRTSQDNANRNINMQQPTGYACRGGEKDHFRRPEVTDHLRRRPDALSASHGSPRGHRSWWDQQQSATSVHNPNRNSHYNRSPKNYHDSSHEVGPMYGPGRDGRIAENVGSNSHRSRGAGQGRTKDTSREGKGFLSIECVDAGGGGDNNVEQETAADQEDDQFGANKKGTKRRLRKKKREKKGVSGLEESFAKLEVNETEEKATPPIIPVVSQLPVEDKVSQEDVLKLASSAAKDKCADTKMSDSKNAVSAQLVKKALNAVAKQPSTLPIMKSELNLTSHESWPELGSEGSVKNNKPALKQKKENEGAGTDANRNKPVASDILEENRTPPDVLERLAKEYIRPLRKRHSKFPKAMFFCHLCEYHCDTVPICNRHVKESRHLKNKSIRELEITLRNLPPPTECHTEVLTDLLLNLHHELALTNDDMKVRQQFVKDLSVKVHKKLPCCEMRLYGSSLTGIGTREADVNIDLVVSDKENPAKILMTVFDILKGDAGLTDVQSDFGAKIPAIHFLEKKHSLKCVVSLNNLTSYKTTCLLAEYAKIDPRVRILGVLFRHWAKLCLIDRQTMGTLPSYSYILMLIYFLQQHSPPVLPVLHEMVKKPGQDFLTYEEASKKWQTTNKESVGALWVELFKFYSVVYKMTEFVISLRQGKPVTRSEKNWSTKKIALEDPYSPKRNLARFISNQILFDYILERFKMTYKYFGIPQTAKGPLFSKLLVGDQGNDLVDNKNVDGSGKRFLEVLDNIAKRTREAKLSQKKDGNNTKGEDDNVIILSVSELKKMNKTVASKPSVNAHVGTKLEVDSVTNHEAAAETLNLKASLKEASKSAKNGKNLATKQDIDGQLEQAESSNRNSNNLKVSSGANDVLGSLSSAIQDDGDSEDLSETSAPVIDDDSEQENCIPASLMEALDDDLEVSSLSGAEGSDNHTPLATNDNVVLNGDLIDEGLSLEDEESHSPVKSHRKNIDDGVREMTVSPEKPEEGTREDQIDTKTVILKTVGSAPEIKSKVPESVKNSSDQSSTKESEELSPKVKCPKTPKIPEELLAQINSLQKIDFCFQFRNVDFTGGKLPSVFCSVCQKEGHLKQECPEEKLPELLPLPRMERKFMMTIDQACYEIYADNCPRDYETAQRLEILDDLEKFIQHHLYPDARLELFGSSCNGFGFAHSDMDICLTFASNKTGEENSKWALLNGNNYGGKVPGQGGEPADTLMKLAWDLKCVPIIESLTEKLKKHKYLYNVIPITTAKVPIVKFTHRPSRLEGDISLYNTLAQHNTRMLLLYSELDRRVKILGYTMKYFAKCCDIGDASRGSLSSYAYILMVIYYLQQRQPPVIPVLQELYDKSKTAPTRIVDGWNAWFLEDAKRVHKMWPYFGNNQESVGELWLGLLRFYTEEFNFQDSVISIRQLKILTRFEKLWNSKCIAIEDPFDLQHNLGAGVSRKMNSYIMKAFIKGRLLFGTPVRIFPHRYHSLKEYLFSPIELTDGAPPNDRGCRLCGKIGHMIKDCPRRRPHNRDRENAGKEHAKDHPRENVQAQSNDVHRGQAKEPNRDQTRDNQRPSREKKGEPFFIEKMLMAPQANQVYPLPNSLQFNNSLLSTQLSRNVLLPTPILSVPFNRTGPQPRPSLSNGQFASNLLMTQQQPHHLTGVRLTSTPPVVANNIQHDEASAQSHTKVSSSMPNLALPCGMTPLVTQPTPKPLTGPLGNVSSTSKVTSNFSVKSSTQHHALPNSGAIIAQSPPPMQYSRANAQVSSTINNPEKGVEQKSQPPVGENNQPKVPTAARPRNVIVAQSFTNTSNPPPSPGHSNAKVSNCISGFDSSGQLPDGNNDMLNAASNIKNINSSTSVLTSPKSASSEIIQDKLTMRSTPYDLLSELMKDRPTMGAPTTVFTAETVKDSLALSNSHLSEKVRLMNSQNLRSSNVGSPNQFSSPQQQVDNVPTSLGLTMPLGQHSPFFAAAPPGFMNVNYHMFPQHQFSPDGSAPFNALHESPVPRGRGRGRGHHPPPPPGIPVASSFSPVFTSPGDNNAGGMSREQTTGQQFPNTAQSPLPQPSQQFTQYPGIFHPYPTRYFPIGLPAYPVAAYGQMPPQQQLHPHIVQNMPAGQASPAPGTQLPMQERGTQGPLSSKTATEPTPISTTAQNRSLGRNESSPIPGNPFPSSHERPSENILLNAMGIMRPNASHDNQWLQLNIAANMQSQTLPDVSRSTGGDSGSPLQQGSRFTFKGNDSD